MQVRFLNFCAAFGVLALTVYILIIGQAMLMPLVLAIVIWYLIISLRRTYERFRIGGYGLPYGMALALAILSAVLVLYLLGVLINSNVKELAANASEYQRRLQELATQAFALFGIQGENPIETVFEQLNLRSLLPRLASTVTGLAGDLGMIIVYVFFLLLEHRTFGKKLDAVARTEEGKNNLRRIFSEISEDIDIYMRIKTWMSILTGSLSYVILRVVGVDFPEFWAILIFLLNFIPTIGSILGVVFPVLMMIFQFDSWPLIIVIAVLLLAIQIVVGNVLEPRFMGRSLNVSALVIILSLALWSYIWGVIGMFLAVPIMVILNIIMSHFPSTRPLAVLMSNDGRIHVAGDRTASGDEPTS